MDQSPTQHVPVMLAEVVAWLEPKPGQVIVDGTLGGGGHARALAERLGDNGLLIALDRDPGALTAAERTLAGLPVKLVHANFGELNEVLEQEQVPAFHGIVLDLGLSSDQLADAQRGFSFDSAGPLDLRFDPSEGEPAWRLLERLPGEQLADLIFRYGEERFSRRIARKIVEQRAVEPIRTAPQLAELVRRSVPRGRGPERIDPATRTFQALRIAVNNELGSLEAVLGQIAERLAVGGRAVVISFHSLEDRIVKQAFRDDARLKVLTKKPLRPTAAEVAANPRARSAKMRVAQRVA